MWLLQTDRVGGGGYSFAEERAWYYSDIGFSPSFAFPVSDLRHFPIQASRFNSTTVRIYVLPHKHGRRGESPDRSEDECVRD